MGEEQLIYRDNIQSGIKFKSFINNPIPSVCYLFYKENIRECIIVDPGNKDISEINKFINEKRLKPIYIIITHEHFDHIGGLEQLRELYSCKVISSEECSYNIIDPKRNFSVYIDQIGFLCKPAEIIIKERFKLKFCFNLEITLIPSPGHSEGSICISFKDILITGDTLLKNLKTVVKLPGGNKSKLIESLKIIQSEFDGFTKIFPGHGEPFSLSEIDFTRIF
jgi:hydroxyacylglutathione hydrolase